MGSTQKKKSSCFQCECSIPCLDESEIGGSDSNIIDILDITFVIISHLAKVIKKFDKKICFVARIWAGYIVDAVEVIIISVNAGGLDFNNWFAQILFGAYIIAIISFAISVSLMEFCCKVKISEYWMRIFIVFKITSFINAMFIFIHPLVIFDDEFQGYEIFIMFIAAVDMVLILVVCVVAILVFGKCIKRRKRSVVPSQNDKGKGNKQKPNTTAKRYENKKRETKNEKVTQRATFFPCFRK